MRIGITLALSGLLIAAPALAQDAPSSPDSRRQMMHERSPVEMLLANAERLALTQEQLTKLQEIQARTQAINEPLLEEMREARRAARAERLAMEPPLTREQRRQVASHMRNARPVLKQIRENSRAAMEQIGEILNDEQKQTLRELVRERRELMREMRGEAREHREEIRRERREGHQSRRMRGEGGRRPADDQPALPSENSDF